LFVDRAKIYVKGGNGGNGVVSFHSDKFVARGGPDGGDGGRGGDVVFVVKHGRHTLHDFRYHQHLRAGRGGHGQGSNRHGRSAQDLTVLVPPGTQLRDAETGRLLADLTAEGQSFVAAGGGRGGRGNARFASPVNKAPRYAEKGAPGEERWLLLELKLIADVGLIGFPNAGKSTFLSRVSAARPKVADYPFTTLTPNLGVVEAAGLEPFVVADIPGLIEGAHKGLGLGHEFLRHVERTRLLLHIVDVAGVDGRDPLKDLHQINEELRLYNQRLAELPQVVVANKMDLPQAAAGLELLRNELGPAGVFPVSAVTGEGVEKVLYHVSSLLKELPPADLREEAPEPLLQGQAAGPEELVITREEDAFVVRGARLEKLVAMTDFDNDVAVTRFQRIFRRLGHEKRLYAAGVTNGDKVRIGEMEFTYWRQED
jgi:GTP-binding protein